MPITTCTHSGTPRLTISAAGRIENASATRATDDASAQLNRNDNAVSPRFARRRSRFQGAAANNWLDLARLYLAHGANVNSRNEEGTNPLGEAAGNGFVEFAKLLIENGANVNQKDDNGKTPLTIAIDSKQEATAKLLREHGGVQ